MRELRCVDGSILTVLPVPCRDRAGKPYEVTLELRRDGQPFARVGERCGFRLSRLAARVSAARRDPEQAAAWPDPDDRFPDAGDGDQPRSLRDYPPAEREYFLLRSRDRTDLPGSGELRCLLRSAAQWQGGPGQPGGPGGGPGGSQSGGVRWVDGWRLTRRVVIEAWGTAGIGVRAVLTSAELVTFLDTVLSEPDAEVRAAPAPAGVKRAGKLLGGIRRPPWRQRGRVPDGIARSRLPALRA
jgi:hypothetical protein